MRADLVELWHEVFFDPYDWIEQFDSERKPETYEYKLNGKAVSALHLFDIEYAFKGEIHKAKYLVGAATYAQYRNKGYMSALIKEAIKDHSEGIFLFPAVRPFYQKLGFQSPCLEAVIGKPEKKLPYSEDLDIERINSIYLSCFSQTGCILKDERAWRESLEENHLLMLSSAYALVSCQTGQVTECAYEGIEGLNQLKETLDEFFVPLKEDSKQKKHSFRGMTTLSTMPSAYIPEIY